jgi:hypothetical protein
MHSDLITADVPLFRDAPPAASRGRALIEESSV